MFARRLIDSRSATICGVTDRREKRARFVKAYLPAYLQRGESRVSRVSRFVLRRWVRYAERRGALEVVGRERLSTEATLFLANHPEEPSMMAAILGVLSDRRLHAAVAKEVLWDLSPPTRWLLKRLGHLPVRETLAHKSESEKRAIVARQPRIFRSAWRRVASRNPGAENRNFVRAASAVLITGGNVLVFPEGLRELRRGESRALRRGLGGFVLVAREYERVTGRPPRLVIVAASGSKRAVRKRIHLSAPFVLSDLPEGTEAPDYVIQKLAELLPPEYRADHRAAAARSTSRAPAGSGTPSNSPSR